MSRCFPFPPPGYTLSGARKEIMIELIKLHKEKQLRKEKRREKKESRKERRERRKNKKDKSDIVKGQQVCSDYKDDLFSEKKCAKIERSSLTEDHGRPNCLPVPTSSCDSTENTSPDEDDSYGHSEAILTRLLSLMESQRESDTGPRKRKEIRSIEGINLRNNGEEICSSSGQIEAGKTVISMSDGAVNPTQGVELRYKDLLESWLPPGLRDTSFYAIDSDWLLHESRRNRDEKRRKCGSGNVSSCRSGGLGARAEYLPQVGVFALPFVIPY